MLKINWDLQVCFLYLDNIYLLHFLSLTSLTVFLFSPDLILDGGADIEYDNVSFSYSGEEDKLTVKNISFKIPKNKSLGVVGKQSFKSIFFSFFRIFLICFR